MLSERGFARAAKGHEIDVMGLSYKSGDQFLSAARGKSNQLAVFIDSTGRAYSVGAHTLPSARGQGEPLSGYFNPPDGASFRAVLIGAPEDKWVVASSAGYGFVVKLEELYANKKAGKTALRVPEGATVVPASPVGAAGARLAAASSDGRLLVFPLEELPELSKGKGNKILAVPSKDGVVLAGICVLAPEQGLRIDSGTRHMVIKAGGPRALCGRARPARHGVAARLADGGPAQRRASGRRPRARPRARGRSGLACRRRRAGTARPSCWRPRRAPR